MRICQYAAEAIRTAGTADKSRGMISQPKDYKSTLDVLVHA